MIRGTEAMDQTIERRPGPGRVGRWLAAAAVALAAAALVGWPAVRRWARAEQSVGLERLRLATVERGGLERDVAVEGRIVAANHPRLYSPAEGTVVLQVRAGAGVESGQLLARVESPQLESLLAQERSGLQALESAHARQEIANRQRNLGNQQDARLRRVRLEAAARELERAERLRAEGLLNQVDHDRAATAVRLAEVELEQAEEAARLEREALEFELQDSSRRVERQRLAVDELERRVRQLELRAPFDGMVATIEVEDRDAVAANQPLLTVVDLSTYEVEVSIPETYADDVAPGTPAVVAYDGRDYPGEVTGVSPEVNASQVEGTVAFVGAAPAGLRQSQRVSTRLVLDRRANVLKVKRGPFLESGGGRRVYVLADGLAELRDIRVGAASVAEVEILEGLREGERILLSDLQQFDGARTVLVRD
jgi:HlyD family secretion protein